MRRERKALHPRASSGADVLLSNVLSRQARLNRRKALGAITRPHHGLQVKKRRAQRDDFGCFDDLNASSGPPLAAKKRQQTQQQQQQPQQRSEKQQQQQQQPQQHSKQQRPAQAAAPARTSPRSKASPARPHGRQASASSGVHVPAAGPSFLPKARSPAKAALPSKAAQARGSPAKPGAAPSHMVLVSAEGAGCLCAGARGLCAGFVCGIYVRDLCA